MSEENATVVESQESVQTEEQTQSTQKVEKTEQEPSKNTDFAKIRVENAKLKKQLEALESEKKERDFAKMSKDQREKAEFESEREKFEHERKAFQLEKQQVQIEADLTEKGLPKAFAKALSLIDDSEEVLSLIEEAVKEQSALIDSKTKALLAGKPPKVSQTTGEAPITKEVFNKMTYVQKMQLYQDDPELYNKFKGD